VFRGSEHGFTAAEFHKRVDNKDDILYVIRTEEQYNRTFGGYFKINMIKSSDGTKINDKDAFIIQIDDLKIFKVKDTASANRYFSNYMLVMGGGADIGIYNNCNQNNYSYTNFPSGYYGPNGVTSRSTETEKYLGGSLSFKVKEIEAFQLIFH